MQSIRVRVHQSIRTQCWALAQPHSLGRSHLPPEEPFQRETTRLVILWTGQPARDTRRHRRGDCNSVAMLISLVSLFRRLSSLFTSLLMGRGGVGAGGVDGEGRGETFLALPLEDGSWSPELIDPLSPLPPGGTLRSRESRCERQVDAEATSSIFAASPCAHTPLPQSLHQHLLLQRMHGGARAHALSAPSGTVLHRTYRRTLQRMPAPPRAHAHHSHVSPPLSLFVCTGWTTTAPR